MAGRRLGALEVGGGGTSPLPMYPCPTPTPIPTPVDSLETLLTTGFCGSSLFFFLGPPLLSEVKQRARGQSQALGGGGLGSHTRAPNGKAEQPGLTGRVRA